MSNASCPSAAVSTRKPALRSLSDTTLRMCDSSSATRIVLPVMSVVLCHLSFVVGASDEGPRTTDKGLLAQIQLEPHARPLAHLALHQHAPVMHRLDDVLHQRQAQPGPGGDAAVRASPVELIEDKGQVLGWDS